MKYSTRLCLLAVLPALILISPSTLACRSQRAACYTNCNRLQSKVARFFCYLGGSQVIRAGR